MTPIVNADSENWSPDQAILPWAEFDGDRVLVHNVRLCRYRSKSDYDVHFEDRAYDLARLKGVDYIVEPFANWRGPAHTFVSFGFEGGQYLAISVEIRKRPGQHFSPLKGLLWAYPITYVVADERDVLPLRVIHRHDDVYLYPLRATPEGVRQLFVDMLRRANWLREHPQRYNTLTNNCTLAIRRHVNNLIHRHVPFSFRLLLPGYSDRLAYDLGWIDTDLGFDDARRRFRITERVKEYADDPDFSVKIRAAE